MDLTSREMINPKQTKKEKYKEHLKKLILNIAETMNDFLADFFCLFVFSQINESNKWRRNFIFVSYWNHWK